MSIRHGDKIIAGSGESAAGTYANKNTDFVTPITDENKGVTVTDLENDWSGKITNCITEIPQDIKLELNNGTLTLKAGSKVYMPNGTGVFDVVTIASDLTLTRTWGTNEQLVIAVDSTGTALLRTGLNRLTSGTTAPTGTNYNWWYDVNENKIKEYVNGAWGNTITSFPIAIVTVPGDSTPTVNSIDQVFNGFGYIGSTIFVLPGVKGLAPNGRNEDGTLKNVEKTVTGVLTYDSYNRSGHEFLFLGSGYLSPWSGASYFIDEYPSPATNKYYKTYSTAENVFYISSNGTPYRKVTAHECLCITMETVYHGNVTKITPQMTFRVVDYNDTEYIAHQAMPSNNYIDLVFPASGGSITMSDDGYLAYRGSANQANGYIVMSNEKVQMSVNPIATTSGAGVQDYLPVKKGDVIHIWYANLTTKTFRLVYAEGSK